MTKRIFILVIFVFLVNYAYMVPASSVIHPRFLLLNKSEQIELINIMIDSRNQFEVAKSQGISDDELSNVVENITFIVLSGDYNDIQSHLRNELSKETLEQFELLLKIKNIHNKRKLLRLDYIRVNELYQSISIRIEEINKISNLFNFVKEEIQKNANDTEIVQNQDIPYFLQAEIAFNNFDYASSKEILIKIKAKMDIRGLQPLRHGYDTIQELKRNNFSTHLLEDIYESAEDEFSVAYFSDILNDSNLSSDPKFKDFVLSVSKDIEKRPGDEFTGVDYKSVREIIQEIDYTVVQIYRINNSIDKVAGKMEFYAARGVNVSESKQLYDEGVLSFAEERYDEAESLLTKADSNLELNLAKLAITGVLAKESIGFLKKNQNSIIITVILVIILGPISYRKIRYNVISNKIGQNKLEHNILIELTKKAQSERFQTGTIDDPTYHIKLDKYMERISKLKSILPVLENMLKKYESPTPLEKIYFVIKKKIGLKKSKVSETK